MRGMQSLWVMVILLLDSLCIKYYAVKLAMLNTKVQSQHILLYGKGLSLLSTQLSLRTHSSPISMC